MTSAVIQGSRLAIRKYGELYKNLDPSVLEMLDDYEAVDNYDPTKPGFTRRQILWSSHGKKPLEHNPWV